MHYGATLCLKLLRFPAVSKCGLQENMRKMIINNTFWMSCKKIYNHRNAVGFPVSQKSVKLFGTSWWHGGIFPETSDTTNFQLYQESENSSEVNILAGLWLPTFRKLSQWIKTIYFNVCAHSWNAWISWKNVCSSVSAQSQMCQSCSIYLMLINIVTLYNLLLFLQNCGFTKVIKERKKTPISFTAEQLLSEF